MGRLSRRRGSGERHRRLRVVVAAARAEHDPDARQGCRQLPVEPADQHGSEASRLRGRHRPERRRHGERRRRREPVPDPRRRHLHADARERDPAGNHSRYRDDARPRARLRSARAGDSARAAVSRGRDLPDRHGGGDHAGPLRGSHPDRRRQARPDHRSAAGCLLRPVQRQDPGQVGLARAGRAGRRAGLQPPASGMLGGSRSRCLAEHSSSRGVPRLAMLWR